MITWDGVGWGGDDDVPLHFHTCEILHFGHTSHGIRWGGDADVLLHLHTCETLHFGHTSHGMIPIFSQSILLPVAGTGTTYKKNERRGWFNLILINLQMFLCVSLV